MVETLTERDAGLEALKSYVDDLRAGKPATTSPETLARANRIAEQLATKNDLPTADEQARLALFVCGLEESAAVPNNPQASASAELLSVLKKDDGGDRCR